MPIRQYVTFFGTHTPWFGICAGIALLAIGIWMIVSFRTLGIEERRQNEILFGFPFMVLFGILTAFVLDAFSLVTGKHGQVNRSDGLASHILAGCLGVWRS